MTREKAILYWERLRKTFSENVEKFENKIVKQYYRTSIEAIDAVPVVRCKECKKWKADGTYEFGIDGVKRMWGSCSNSLHHCKDNHFCSYGEKED